MDLLVGCDSSRRPCMAARNGGSSLSSADAWVFLVAVIGRLSPCFGIDRRYPPRPCGGVCCLNGAWKMGRGDLSHGRLGEFRWCGRAPLMFGGKTAQTRASGARLAVLFSPKVHSAPQLTPR